MLWLQSLNYFLSISFSSTTSNNNNNNLSRAQSSNVSDINSPLIQEDGDNKVLKLRFDVSQYTPEEIVVKTVDNKLMVKNWVFHTQKTTFSCNLFLGSCQARRKNRHEKRLSRVQPWIFIAQECKPRDYSFITQQRWSAYRRCSFTPWRCRNYDSNCPSLSSILSSPLIFCSYKFI